MLQLIPLKLGKLNGTVFDFPEIDDTLVMHKHSEMDVHITVVARGSFRVHGEGYDMTSKAGDVLDWDADQLHEFIALEPNSRIVNIIKD